MRYDLTGMIARIEEGFGISKTSFSIHRNVLNGSPGGLSNVERHQQKLKRRAETIASNFDIYFFLYSRITLSVFSGFLFESFLQEFFAFWKFFLSLSFFHIGFRNSFGVEFFSLSSVERMVYIRG